MSSERPTVRPVTLARLAEVTFLADDEAMDTTTVKTELDVTTHRARETILEAERINLIEERDTGPDEQVHTATSVGNEFLAAIQAGNWSKVGNILQIRSPHYGSFLDVVKELGPIDPEEALNELEERAEVTPYKYNKTSLDVVGDWAQRLGVLQRNAFTGAFYMAEKETVPETFPYQLLETVDKLEETAGVNLQQRYLSIPELREDLCEQIGCSRSAFDKALVELAEQNVGILELSGAPIDTGAKDARYGIKTIRYVDKKGIVTTEQSSEQIMSGVELLGKKYYYLTVHDEGLQFKNQ